MGNNFVIDWPNFGMHYGEVVRVHRVKTNTGGTMLANKKLKKKMSHRTFLTKEETEVLTSVLNDNGVRWMKTNPELVATKRFGKYAVAVTNAGRFFTDHPVGYEPDEYVAPEVPEAINRGFTPIAAYKEIKEASFASQVEPDVDEEVEVVAPADYAAEAAEVPSDGLLSDEDISDEPVEDAPVVEDEDDDEPIYNDGE